MASETSEVKKGNGKRREYLERIENHLAKAEQIYADAMCYFSDHDADEFLEDESIREAIQNAIDELQEVKESL